MGKYLEKAKVLRKDPNAHYNCAQAVMGAFAPDAGLSMEDACRVSANFGGGMKMAATCGAVTSALMVLGLYGIEDPVTVGELFRTVRDNHNGCLNCADLLRMNREAGGAKKPHCDGMVYEAVTLLEQILAKSGKI
jgi:C_GCAxxG_C_C family probable redox protein